MNNKNVKKRCKNGLFPHTTLQGKGESILKDTHHPTHFLFTHTLNFFANELILYIKVINTILSKVFAFTHIGKCVTYVKSHS